MVAAKAYPNLCQTVSRTGIASDCFYEDSFVNLLLIKA